MPHPSVYTLFVYGSLRSGFQNPAYEYISSYFEPMGMGRVKGVLADLGDFPAAVPGDGNTYIVGELYRLKEPAQFSWAFGQLDDYEGVIVEADEAQMYRREVTTVYTDGAAPAEAWIYWYNGSVAGKPLVPSGDIFEYLKNKMA